MVEIIYRDDRRPAERLRDELGNVTASGIPSQTTVTLNSTRTTTNVYECGYQTRPAKPSLLNE
jgi:hypothetical protein